MPEETKKNTDDKIKTLRLKPETYDKFNNFIKDSNLTTADAVINSLLLAYATGTVKEEAPATKTDIESFIAHLNAIQENFLHMVYLNQDTEIRVKADFIKALESKDKVIEDLQEQLERLKKDNADKQEAFEELDELMKEETAEKISYCDRVTELNSNNETLKQSLKDKENIIDQLKRDIASLETVKADAQKRENEIETLETAIADAEKNISIRDTTIATLKSDIEHNNMMHKQALDMAEQIKNTAVASAIAETKSTYMDKLFKLQEDNSNLKDQVRKLERLLEKAAKVETDDNSGTDAEETPEEQLENQLTFD